MIHILLFLAMSAYGQTTNAVMENVMAGGNAIFVSTTAGAIGISTGTPQAGVDIETQNASGYSLLVSSGIDAPNGVVNALQLQGNGVGITHVQPVNIDAGTFPSGASDTCTGGQFLQNQTVSGGIVTGGTCAAASTGGALLAATQTWTAAQTFVQATISSATIYASSLTIQGITNGSSAGPGTVGEFISLFPTGNVTPNASGFDKHISTITLTAGVWEVSGVCALDTGATTALSSTGMYCAITTSAEGNALDTAGANNWSQLNAAAFNVSAGTTLHVGPRIMNITTTTPVYLSATISYSTLGGAVWIGTYAVPASLFTSSGIQAVRIR